MRRRTFLLGASAAPWLAAIRSGAADQARASREGSGEAEPDRGAVGAQPYYWAWWGWEPLEHYRRCGGVVGAVDADAPWLERWFDRLHSEKLVRMMTDLGVNLAVTHFFKGFGLQHERAHQARTKQLVEIAHRYGLRVLGYCQTRSLYYETFLGEQPDAEQWAQRDAQGRPRTWGSAYFRWTPCILSRPFRDYLKRVIRVGLEDIGLDGLHFDNDYAQPCYCSRCEAAFRRWLGDRCAGLTKRFGIRSADHVRQPPERTPPSRIADPLERAWVRFRCEMLAQFHQELAAHARRLRPEVILLGNPAHPRSLDGPYRRSVWPPAVGRSLDLMFAENGNSPCVDQGDWINQIRAYKQGRATGYRVLSTTWRRGPATTEGLPETREHVRLGVFEAAAHQGVPGANWALRPLGEGDRMRIDRPELRQALRDALAFVREHESQMAGARPVADVAVLRTFASLAFDSAAAYSYVLGAEEGLLRGGYCWETVYGHQLDQLERFQVLVLAGQRHLSDRQIEAVRRFIKKGGGLVLAGPCGLRDENGRVRGPAVWDELTGPGVVRVPDAAARASVAAGYQIRVRAPRQWPVLAGAVERAAQGRLTARLVGGQYVAISAYRTTSGLTAHVLHYAAPQPAAGLQLQLGSPWRDAVVTWRDADDPGRSVELEAAAGVVQLPPLRCYAVAQARRRGPDPRGDKGRG